MHHLYHHSRPLSMADFDNQSWFPTAFTQLTALQAATIQSIRIGK